MVERLEEPREESRLGGEHLARYRFAAGLARGRVLDLGCGTGYGSLLLASEPLVSRVVAADRSRRALAAVAARREGLEHPARLEPVRVDAAAPQLATLLGGFDTIVCLETLEHVHDDLALLGSCCRMLHRGGRFVLSTPLGRGRGIPTGDPFHVRQYAWPELRRLLTGHFALVGWYGQQGGTVEVPRPGSRYRIAVAVCARPRSTAWSGAEGGPADG